MCCSCYSQIYIAKVWNKNCASVLWQKIHGTCTMMDRPIKNPEAFCGLQGDFKSYINWSIVRKLALSRHSPFLLKVNFPQQQNVHVFIFKKSLQEIFVKTSANDVEKDCKNMRVLCDECIRTVVSVMMAHQ